MKQYRYFSFITGIFCACLVISNILDTKLFSIGGSVFPAGIILFPVVYVFGDVFTEVYGYSQSRKAIWAGFFSLLILVVSVFIARYLPQASSWKNQNAFEITLTKVPRIAIASIIAYFSGEFVNSFVISKLKLRQKGKMIAVRFIVSTVAGQAVDTSVFILIAFTGLMKVDDLLILFFSAWSFKVVWEILALPISLIIVRRLKKMENEDYFDEQTNYNPFKL